MDKLKKKHTYINYYIRKSVSKDLTQSILNSLQFIDSEYILILDCDMQHDLNAIQKMVDIINNEKYSLVIGSRDIIKIKGLKRRYISFIGIWVTKLIGINKLLDPLSGFFIIETKKFKEIAPKIQTRGYKVLLSIIFFLSDEIKYKEIKINFFSRKFEKSKLNYKIIFFFILQIISLLKIRIKNNLQKFSP